MNDSLCTISKLPYTIFAIIIILFEILLVVVYFYENYNNRMLYLVYSLLVIQMLMLFGNLFFCFSCHSFKTTLIHEIGHIIGLGHVDDNINLINK